MILSLVGLWKRKKKGTYIFLVNMFPWQLEAIKSAGRERGRHAPDPVNVSCGPYCSYQVGVIIPFCRQGNRLSDERREACGRLPGSHIPGPLTVWTWSECVGLIPSSLTPAGCGNCQGRSPPPLRLAGPTLLINKCGDSTIPSSSGVRIQMARTCKCSEHWLHRGPDRSRAGRVGCWPSQAESSV